MSNSNILHVRMDSTLKENVANILDTLGLSESDAVKLFYKQIELHGGLPFDVKIPERILAEQKIVLELREAENSIKKEGTIPLDKVKKDFNL